MSEKKIDLNTPRFRRLLGQAYDARLDLLLMRALERIDRLAEAQGVKLEPYRIPAKREEEVTIEDERFLSELGVAWD